LGKLATASDKFKKVYREIARQHLKGKKPEIVKVMTRMCPPCGEWSRWKYVAVEINKEDRVFGICGSCGVFVERMKKVYIERMLDNPIHKQERILFESPRFQEIVQDEIIDVGYVPDNAGKQFHIVRGEGL